MQAIQVILGILESIAATVIVACFVWFWRWGKRYRDTQRRLVQQVADGEQKRAELERRVTDLEVALNEVLIGFPLTQRPEVQLVRQAAKSYDRGR